MAWPACGAMPKQATDTYRRDQRVAEWCRTHGVPWHEYRQDVVVRRLRSRNGWSARWEKHMAQETAPLPRRYRDPGSRHPPVEAAQLTGIQPSTVQDAQRGGGHEHRHLGFLSASTQRLLSKRYHPALRMDWLQSLESLSGLGLSFDENVDTGSPNRRNLEGPAGRRWGLLHTGAPESFESRCGGTAISCRNWRTNQNWNFTICVTPMTECGKMPSMPLI